MVWGWSGTWLDPIPNYTSDLSLLSRNKTQRGGPRICQLEESIWVHTLSLCLHLNCTSTAPPPPSISSETSDQHGFGLPSCVFLKHNQVALRLDVLGCYLPSFGGIQPLFSILSTTRERELYCLDPVFSPSLRCQRMCCEESLQVFILNLNTQLWLPPAHWLKALTSVMPCCH